MGAWGCAAGVYARLRLRIYPPRPVMLRPTASIVAGSGISPPPTGLTVPETLIVSMSVPPVNAYQVELERCVGQVLVDVPTEVDANRCPSRPAEETGATPEYGAARTTV